MPDSRQDSADSNRSDSPTDCGESEDLLPLVYEELRRVAQHKMNDEAGAQTLTPTALVHEAYLRISNRKERPSWDSPRQFFSAAAEAMRRILIDRARAKKQLKRGGESKDAELIESQVIAPTKDDDLLAVNEALELLEIENPEAAELVKLRYFAGMTWEEIGDASGVPDRTNRRLWTWAKAWLQERIERL